MLTTGGRLGDVFGRKRMFLLGISGFLAGSRPVLARSDLRAS